MSQPDRTVRIDNDDTDLTFGELDRHPDGYAEPQRGSDQPTDYPAYGGHTGETETFVKSQNRS